MKDIDKIELLGGEEVIIFNDPSYEGALIGVTMEDQAVYDFDRMIKYLIENGEAETYEEAADFILFNNSFRQGERYPIIINSIIDWSDDS